MRPIRLYVFLIVGCLQVGCGNSTTSVNEERLGSNLSELAVWYHRFVSTHSGRPPGDEENFKKFIQAYGFQADTGRGINTVDDLFMSPRDQKPYIVVYGKQGSFVPDIIAYEQDGVDGRRWLASSMTTVAEVDSEKFRKLVPETR